MTILPDSSQIPSFGVWKGFENDEKGSMELRRSEKITFSYHTQYNHVILRIYDIFERGAI